MLMPSIFRDNFAEDMFDDFFRFPEHIVTQPTTMQVDVKEFDDKYEVDVALPGYKKEDIQAELKNGYLTISAKREENKDEKDDQGKYIRRERYTGSCKRSFYIGSQIKQEEIGASYEDGILKLSVPRKTKQPEVEENHYITIQ